VVGHHKIGGMGPGPFQGLGGIAERFDPSILIERGREPGQKGPVRDPVIDDDDQRHTNLCNGPFGRRSGPGLRSGREATGKTPSAGGTRAGCSAFAEARASTTWPEFLQSYLPVPELTFS